MSARAYRAAVSWRAAASPVRDSVTPCSSRDRSLAPVAGERWWPTVSVVVVNYNGGQALTRCLETVLASSYRAQEVLVVDNASTDGSAAVLETLAAAHPHLRSIRSTKNLGYAGAVNLALGASRGSYIAVLNMDTVVEPDWLERLVDVLEREPAVGAASPLIALADGWRVNALGQDVHVSGLGFNRGLGRSLGSFAPEPVEVSGIHGAAFVIRRVLLEQLGGMDATGFLYHEDVNLSWLVRLAGYRLAGVPTSVVRHDYFLSMYPEKLYLLERNRWAMLLAYLRCSTLLALSPALVGTEALVWGYCLLRGGTFARAKVASYQWIWRQRQQIRRRRALAESVRRVSDWALLKQLRWAYCWRQFTVLGRERGASRRQPAGGLPVDVGLR